MEFLEDNNQSDHIVDYMMWQWPHEVVADHHVVKYKKTFSTAECIKECHKDEINAKALFDSTIGSSNNENMDCSQNMNKETGILITTFLITDFLKYFLTLPITSLLRTRNLELVRSLGNAILIIKSSSSPKKSARDSSTHFRRSHLGSFLLMFTLLANFSRASSEVTCFLWTFLLLHLVRTGNCKQVG